MSLPRSSLRRSSVHDGRRAWLRSAPDIAEQAEAGAIVCELSRRVACALGCAVPGALDAPAPPPGHAMPWLDSAPHEILDPDLLGEAWEQLLASRDRRVRGSHFTPRVVAEAVVRSTFDFVPTGDEPPSVLDPAVGGGAFLLAAARLLEDRGFSRARIVGRLHGVDIDPVAARVADAALELWSRGVARPKIVVGDTLTSKPLQFEQFDVIIGNPPFLSQLVADTSRDPSRRDRLVDRFGDAAAGYVDEAALFLLAAITLGQEGAVISMVVPQSILGATGALAARDAMCELADLAALWVEPGGSFVAAVDVVAPIFVRRPRSETTVVLAPDNVRIELTTPPPRSWAPLLGAASGVPQVRLDIKRTATEAETLEAIAKVTAGFRQHFYGIANAVREQRSDTDVSPKLVTSGAIEPLWLRWGERPIMFAKRRWLRPVLDIDAIEDESVRRWFFDRCRPKLLVASQTQVLEVVVDIHATLVPSVPVICIEPHDPDNLFRVAALLTGPNASAHIAALGSGTGMSASSIRVRASAIADLPLHRFHGSSMGRAAEAARRAQHCSSQGDWVGYAEQLDLIGRETSGDDSVGERARTWWWNRLRFPPS